MTLAAPPRRVVENYAAFDFRSPDLGVHFRIIAGSEELAKVEALDKIGYKLIVEDDGLECFGPRQKQYQLVDVEDQDDVDSVFMSYSLDEALDIALKNIGWSIDEPTMMVGGIVGGEGFAGTDN